MFLKFRAQVGAEFVQDPDCACKNIVWHYSDVIMSAMASQIISLTNFYSMRRSKKTSKLRVTGLCDGNSPVTGEFPAQKGQ